MCQSSTDKVMRRVGADWCTLPLRDKVLILLYYMGGYVESKEKLEAALELIDKILCGQG